MHETLAINADLSLRTLVSHVSHSLSCPYLKLRDTGMRPTLHRV